MKAVISKELQYYLNNPVGYIVVILFGVFVNFLYTKDIFVSGAFSLQSFFLLMPWIFLVFIPALAMRIVAEEKRTNTLEILLALPLSETVIVMGKFIALLCMLGISLLLTFSVPLSISMLAPLQISELIVGYAGVFLMGACFTSISLFFSAKTKNQIVAFLGSAITLFILLGLSSDLLATTLPKTVQDALVIFGPYNHLQNFAKGIIDFRSLVYFLSFTAAMLILTVEELKKRN